MLEMRVLDRGENSGFTNMAIDEAIAMHAQEIGPTLSVYCWKPKTVTIGYFQGMTNEVDVEQCKIRGIDCIRRVTGGGAVFHDTELTYSFICTVESGIVSRNILESYKQICNGLIFSLKELGIESQFAGINDIVSNGKKISGNAQTRKNLAVLQHGTLLLDVDVETMFALLKVPNEKIRDKLISDVKQRVTSVKQILGREVNFNEAKSAVFKGFEKAFDAKLVPGKLQDCELADAEKIKQRILSDEWNFMR